MQDFVRQLDDQTLEVLDLGSNCLSGSGAHFSRLFGSTKSSIRILNLEDNSLLAADAAELAKAMHEVSRYSSTSVLTLNVGSNMIGRAGVLEILKLVKYGRVNLGNNGLPWREIEELILAQDKTIVSSPGLWAWDVFEPRAKVGYEEAMTGGLQTGRYLEVFGAADDKAKFNTEKVGTNLR